MKFLQILRRVEDGETIILRIFKSFEYLDDVKTGILALNCPKF